MSLSVGVVVKVTNLDISQINSNAHSNFPIAFGFIKNIFISVISYLDKIQIFGEFSVLDFNIVLLVFGAVLPIVIVTVKNWSNSAHNNAVRERRYNKNKSSRSNGN